MGTRRDSSEGAREIATVAATKMPTTVRRAFGLPIGVSRLVDLPRAPTDREWGQLVAGFRTVFGVQGRTTTDGALREWSHGNLHISVESVAGGEQLRVSDRKDEAVAINGLGFLVIGMGVVMAAIVAATGNPGKAALVLGGFGAMSMLPFFAANLVRTPAWARDRERQIETIVDDAVRLLSTS